jgi:hypothetical protein
MWDDRQESRVIGIICLHRDRSSMNIYSYTAQPFDEYCFSPSACTLCRRKARTVSSFRPFKMFPTSTAIHCSQLGGIGSVLGVSMLPHSVHLSFDATPRTYHMLHM